MSWRRCDAITASCHGGTSSPLDQASHPQPCVPGACLDQTPSPLAFLVLPPEFDRAHRQHDSLFIRCRSATGTLFDALASIGSQDSQISYTTLLVAANTAFFGVAVVVIWEMEMEMDSERVSSYQGEPMLVDGLEEGLPFPHVVGEDGHHTVQHIDM